VKIELVSMALRNFIRKHVVKDSDFQPYDDYEDLLPPETIYEAQEESSIQQSETSNENYINIKRDRTTNLLITL
jgi:hypothetical protein